MTRAAETCHKSERKYQTVMSKIEKKGMSKRQRVGKSSSGNHDRKKKVQFSTREFSDTGRSTGFVGKKHPSRRQVELMETELRKMKAEIRDSAESVRAAKAEAKQVEFNLEVLINTKNELLGKLLEMKAIEASFMGFFD